MAKVLRCKDGGLPCDWEGKAETEEELIQKAIEHAKTGHGMAQIPDFIMTQMRGLIKDVA